MDDAAGSSAKDNDVGDVGTFETLDQDALTDHACRAGEEDFYGH
jgi:hypothetical protein